MKDDLENKKEKYIEESKINKFLKVEDLKDLKAGQAIINFNKNIGLKAKYYQK